MTRVDNDETVPIRETKDPCFVENVRKMDSGMFWFNLVGNPTEYKSSYPWAFVVVTEENMVRYQHYRELEEAELLIKRITTAALKSVETLKGDW